LKEYVRVVSGFSMSDRALGPLSAIVREAADEAVRNARADGRRTLLDRDVSRRKRT
jgi:histone H3/H4